MNNELIIKHMPYADALAKTKKRTTSVSYEDLQSAAYYGLCDAATRYEKDKDFKNFVKKRILGEMEEQRRLLTGCAKQLVDVPCEFRSFNDIDMVDFVDKLLKPLSRVGRRLIEMHYLESCDHIAISKEIGCSIDSVPVLLSYYRGILRRRWKDDGIHI